MKRTTLALRLIGLGILVQACAVDHEDRGELLDLDVPSGEFIDLDIENADTRATTDTQVVRVRPITPPSTR